MTTRCNPQLAKIEAKLDSLEKLVTTIRLDIATLKVKSGVWGALAGIIAAAAAYLLAQT